jgi:hypothetical protein
MSLRLIFKTYLGTLNGLHNHTAWTVFHWSGCYRANLSPVQHSDRKFDYLPTYSLISPKVNMGLTWKRNGRSVASVKEPHKSVNKSSRTYNWLKDSHLYFYDYEFFTMSLSSELWTSLKATSCKVNTNNNNNNNITRENFRECSPLFNSEHLLFSNYALIPPPHTHIYIHVYLFIYLWGVTE